MLWSTALIRWSPAAAEGSPLRDAGDPADGIGNDIGAVQVNPLKPPRRPSAPKQGQPKGD